VDGDGRLTVFQVLCGTVLAAACAAGVPAADVAVPAAAVAVPAAAAAVPAAAAAAGLAVVGPAWRVGRGPAPPLGHTCRRGITAHQAKTI
jgi:hypothetical protein